MRQQRRIDAQGVAREAGKEACDRAPRWLMRKIKLWRSSPKQKAADAVLKDADAACVEAPKRYRRSKRKASGFTVRLLSWLPLIRPLLHLSDLRERHAQVLTWPRS